MGEGRENTVQPLPSASFLFTIKAIGVDDDQKAFKLVENFLFWVDLSVINNSNNK
jgi:hypothetical protein